jgi:Putative prokaryotic signal transducing protein
MTMADRPVEIFRAANSQHAQMLRQMLEERGIKAFIVNEALQTAGGDLPLGWTAAPRILVAEEDAVKGRLIAEQFDAVLRDGESVTTDDFEVASADWTDWPLCPNCRQRREVLCNICGSRGSKFALADSVEEQGRTQVLLFCDSCDDHFRPQFFRICHRCGHDFGSGVEAEPVQQKIELPENTGRTWLVIGGLVLFAVAMGAYFYWLLTMRPG